MFVSKKNVVFLKYEIKKIFPMLGREPIRKIVFNFYTYNNIVSIDNYVENAHDDWYIRLQGMGSKF